MNNLDTNFPNDEIFFSAPKPQHFHTKDETIRIVGNKMYKRPKDEHLHGFIRNLLGYTLKKHWVNAQLQLAFEERHKIMQWVKAEEIFMKKIEISGQIGKMIYPSGDVKEQGFPIKIQSSTNTRKMKIELF